MSLPHVWTCPRGRFWRRLYLRIASPVPRTFQPRAASRHGWPIWALRNVEDLSLAAAELAKREMGPELLIGHSLGGAAIIAAAAHVPQARAVVTIGAPFDPEHVTHNFGSAVEEIKAKGAAEVQLGGRAITIGAGFLEDVATSRLEDALRGLNKSLLVLHAPLDQTVGVENATQIFTHAKHPKSFITLCDADHLITREKDAEYAADVIAAWSSKYLDLRPPAPPIGAPEGVLRVREHHDDDPHVCAAQEMAAGACLGGRQT